MVTRSNQGKTYKGQLKKKITITSEDKLPNTILEDIKDLYSYYDKENLQLINYGQLKSILHFITGGIMSRTALESFITENTQKTNNFELKDVEKLATKLWEEVGKDQHQKEINSVLKGLQPYTNNDEFEAALKAKLYK